MFIFFGAWLMFQKGVHVKKVTLIIASEVYTCSSQTPKSSVMFTKILGEDRARRSRQEF